MLVTFKTKAYADITMFGDVAVSLLKLMGHSGTVPGALRPEDLPEALEKLKSAIARAKQTEARERKGGEEQTVSLSHRALPLIELLEAANHQKAHVMWDK